jgi:hypothetical protein
LSSDTSAGLPRSQADAGVAISGETESNISSWTTDSLHAHILSLLADQREYFDRIYIETEKRFNLARDDEERSTTARFENYRIQRDDDRRMADATARLTAEATQGHLDSRRQWQDGHLAIHRVEKDALDRASSQMDRRLESMNEFRDQLRDQATAFVGRPEFLAALAALDRAAQVDHDRLADMVTRAEMNLQFDALKSQLGVTQKSITDVTQLLAQVRSRDAGRSSGTTEAIDAAERAAEADARRRTYVISAITAAVTIAGILVGLFIGLHNHAATSPPVTTKTGIHATPAPTPHPQ